MNRLIIVRHGNTFEADQTPLRIGARTDLPLTIAGEAQAEALGRHFAERGLCVGRVLSGRLRRQRDTARSILTAMEQGGRIETADFLDEIDHGPDEGMPETAVEARIGRAAIDLWDREGRPPPGWVVEAEGRIAGWRQLLASPPPGDTLLVTSNGAARFALQAESALSQGLAGQKLRTGAYGELILEGAGGWQRIAWDVRP